MRADSKQYYKTLKAKKEAILAENDIDPDLYDIYWFKGAKHLTRLERDISKLDFEILKMELENSVSLN